MYLKNKFNITIDQIDLIKCYISLEQSRNLRFAVPRNGNEAKFSVPYCIGVILHRGKITLDDFKETMIYEPVVRKLIPKISVITRQSPSNEQEIVIRLKSGKEFSKKIIWPKGDPLNPISDDELFNKFINNTKKFLSKKDIDRVLNIIMNIEKIESLSELYQIVTYFD